MSYLTDGIRRGTFANRPSSAPEGTLYMCTDGPVQFIRKDGYWNPYLGSLALPQLPAAASFTLVQTGSSATITDDAGILYFQSLQRVTTEDSILAAQVNPGGTGAAYTLTVGFFHTPSGQNTLAGFKNYHITGIGIYNTTNTHLRNYTVYTNATGEFRFQLANKTGALTGTGSLSGGFDVGGYSLINGSLIWMRVEDDGTTNRTWSVSDDGKHFKKVLIEARTTGFGAGASNQPDRIGMYINPWNADAQMTVLSYQLTSP